MSTIACPGCRLPRDVELANVPCPVCGPAPVVAAVVAPVAQPIAHDPTKALPSDVSEMRRTAPQEGFPAWFGWLAVFFFGVATGAGGLLAWQMSHTQPTPDTARVASNSPRPLPELPQLPSKRLEVAPFPHEAKPTLEPSPTLPQLTSATSPTGQRVVTIELNSPHNNYSIPFAMKSGEQLVLKGRINKLSAFGLDAGAILDASGLEAAQVYIDGRVDSASVLKVNCPNGKVTMAAAVLGKSSVEINAPGGDVTFTTATTPNRPGSIIDGGSTVTITARTAELRGDINGSDTKVTVNIPSAGMLKVAAIRGTANVEYRVAEGRGTPEVAAEFVSPAAAFRKLN